MKKTALLLGLHCHQPVDNFHEVLEEAIAKSYLPFFEVASAYPEFIFSVHYSGWLLEYIKEYSPKLFGLMQELALRGQVEFLTGGFYEPILASIPSKDRRAQIDKLSAFIKEHFGQKPKGLWLTERVWDGAIAKDLVKCGIEYVVVDDYHFISSGFDKENLNGYFLTEEEGKVLKLFPINKTLRYKIPFSPENDACAYLESIAEENLSAGVIFDDGEKFGIWPQTYEWVYEKEWLKRFIEAVLESEQIEAMTYETYLQKAKPISLAYLPTTSYYEMGEWSLRPKDALMLEKVKKSLEASFDADTIEKFVKGSIWKNFLVKYYESNHIHKRMLSLSADADKKNAEYMENLYKAQCNDVLWHGVFGGIYLPNLRDNAYRFIIGCENALYDGKECIEVSDINCDGYEEIRCLSDELIAVFDTKTGGQLCELDIRDKAFNFANTLTRYEEAYHDKIKNPPQNENNHADGISTIHDISTGDLEKYKPYLITDKHFKNCFVDHIVGEDFTLESFKKATFHEYGDFSNRPFTIVKQKKKRFSLQREGAIFTQESEIPATLTKKFQVQKNEITFTIKLETEQQPEKLYYVIEHNLHFANSKEILIEGEKFEQDIMLLAKESLEIYDPYTQKTIIFKLNQPVDVYICSLDTLSQSEAGFELVNQGVMIGVRVKKSVTYKGFISIK